MTSTETLTFVSPAARQRGSVSRLLVLLAACALLAPLPAQAREQAAIGDSGNAFLDRCGKDRPEPCRAYISGIVDGLIVAGMALKTNLICPPAGVTTSQVYDLVVDYLRDNPGLRHLRTDSLTHKALAQSFACVVPPKKKPAKWR
ncbi:Rap1a/Tai family immunity protein [Sphingosinicella sp. BN140058]|uniref:Rap1a/Tai family immunity protein n=1 Tax=Sphingosinicella sp. BN140058 TaxID=1892855 RepID=UPI001010A2AE|nr:Rap1a/Tai family immunity protein [Sphingosinicella sp. BN140058]QAY75278.1 hypothetical protein ETR14_01090 [Sphingosinicella sp. BN140058]